MEGMTMIGNRVCEIALGLPVTEERAEQLAFNITIGADSQAIDSLVELILAIAPLYRRIEEYPELDVHEFEQDLAQRAHVAKNALGVLFTTSDAFLDAFSRYVDEHKRKYSAEELVKELGLSREAAGRLANKPADKRASKEGRAKR
jgi:hypothetical protein